MRAIVVVDHRDYSASAIIKAIAVVDRCGCSAIKAITAVNRRGC